MPYSRSVGPSRRRKPLNPLRSLRVVAARPAQVSNALPPRILPAALLALLFAIPAFSQSVPNSALASARASDANPQSSPQDCRPFPLSFEQNEGQADRRVKFLARSNGYSLFLTSSGAVLSFSNPSPRPKGAHTIDPPPSPAASLSPQEAAAFELHLVGARKNPEITGRGLLPGVANYFIGANPANWRANVPTFASVAYHDVYPGIDLIFYQRCGKLEYDFVVRPGADPARIRLRIPGGHIRQDLATGDLLLGGARDLRIQNPVSYQLSAGSQRPVSARFLLKSPTEIAFHLGDYDRSRALVIDPVFSYSTYFGGSGTDQAYGVAADSSGNAYTVGYTTSADFPVSQDPLQPALQGQSNIFVFKMNSNGSALLYSTYLGGSYEDYGYAIAVDSLGNAYVTGSTGSADFPLVNPYQSTLKGSEDAFVAKINPSGSALLFSTYLGGSGSDCANGIAVDAAGSAYVVGCTDSPDFPVLNAAQTSLGGDFDAFVTKLSPSGSALVYSTYLGGAGADEAYAVALDSDRDAYVTGGATSPDFPTANALQPAYQGSFDAFVTKLSPDGSTFLYSTYLGGYGIDIGAGIAVDSSKSAYVTGYTNSGNFPTVNPLNGKFQGSNDEAFVSKLAPDGSSLLYSTYLGGSMEETASAIAVDSTGNAYVAGTTYSNDFPAINALQPAFGGGQTDAFFSMLNPSGSLLLVSTFLGGSGSDYAAAIAVDPFGKVYVAGSTGSVDFPVSGGLQPNYAGNSDAFVSKISLAIPGDFSGSFDTFSQQVAPGGSAVYNLTVQPSGGFNGDIQFTATNVPIGVTVSFSPQILRGGSGATVVTVSTSSFTPNGSYNIGITATCIGLVRSTSVALQVGAVGDFTGSFDHTTANASLSSPAAYLLTLSPLGGFNAPVTLSASELPVGASVTFTPSTVNGGSGSSLISVSISSATPSGLLQFKLTASTPGLSHSTYIYLLVGAPDFTGTLTPTYQAVAAGGSAQFTLSLHTIGTQPFSNSVTPSFPYLPPGVTAAFNPPTINPDANGSSVVTLSTTANLTQGSYQLSLVASGGGQTHSSPVTLAVSSPSQSGDFSGSFNATSLSAIYGGDLVEYVLTLVPSGGFNGSVALSVSNLPPGTTFGGFSPSVIPGGSGSSTLFVETSSSTPKGIYSITVTASSGSSLIHQTSVTLLVGVTDFTGTVTPASQVISRGSSAQFIVSISTVGSCSFGQNVSLFLSGLPSGVTASFSPAAVNPDAKGSSILTISASSSAPPGSYAPVLTATGGGVTHTRPVPFTVQ